MSTRQDFRNLLNELDVMLVAGAHDAVSAKLAEEAGFPAVWASGFGIAYAQQFRPDANLLTMVENADAAAHMVDAVSVPVIADLDNGYGNAINVTRTIREYIRAGVAAVELEDQSYPKRCGIFPGKQRRFLVSTSEMCGKIRAARDTAGDDLFLIARTDAFDTDGTVDEVLERLCAYVDSGADAVTAISPHIEQQKAYASRWNQPDVPLMVTPTLIPELTANDFGDMGFKIVLYSVQVLQAAMKGMQNVLTSIKERGEFGSSLATDQLIPFSSMVDMIGLRQLGELEARYIG